MGPPPKLLPAAPLPQLPREAFPLPANSALQGPWHLQAPRTPGSISGPFCSLTLPSDPWDPGVTAQDLLFRGGYQFRRQPQAVLDVTEQVSGPTADSATQPGLCLVTWPPFLLQLSRFLWDHGDIAFAPLGKLMLENFKLEGARVSKPWPARRGGSPLPVGVSPRACELDEAFPHRAALRRRQWSA